jgi:hypothetical protein
VRGQPQFDLRIVGAEQDMAGRGDERLAIWRPISVRIGMFCKLGSFDESRPVCAPTRL